MTSIRIPLGERAYPVHIENGILRDTGRFTAELGRIRKVLIVTDDHVAPLYLETVTASLQSAGLQAFPVILPGGEATKSLPSLQTLYSRLAACGLTRSDAVLALGGGVMGDLAGLAAATWLRGVRFIQVPTTLLAQVDSSVGGKVAIDLPEGKNLVGAFYQPSLVLCDPLTLNSLTPAFWTDGLGEVVKYGCIMDPDLFVRLERLAPGGRPALMEEMTAILEACIRDKAKVVAEDEHDVGSRMILNFGHTLGHAIETCQHYAGLSHGCAVAVGMQIISEISERRCLTENGTAARLHALLTALGLPVSLPSIPAADLLAAMRMDKKAFNSTLHLIILDRIGQCRILDASPDFFASLAAR